MEDLKVNGKKVSRNELIRIKKSMDIMSPTIEAALEKGGASEIVARILRIY